MRLVHRDKGCAVCLATGIQELYEYPDDSNRYEGAHIIDFAYHVLVSHFLVLLEYLFHYSVIIKWDARAYSAAVSDPAIPPMPTIRSRVRAHGQSRISGELTPWRMGCCFACSIIRIMTISAFRFMLMLVNLAFLVWSPTLLLSRPIRYFLSILKPLNSRASK
jgi:hypothetical protein